MAKGSPKKYKKESPSDKKNSPTKSKKESPKDKKSPKKGNKSNEDEEELIKKIFARKRFDTVEAVFKRKSKHLVLLTKRVHIWETWHKLPVVTQMCNSNAEIIAEEIEEPKILFESAILEGVVYINKRILPPKECLFVEVVAEFRYHSQAVIPPIPPRFDLHHVCYRDYVRILPINFERQIEANSYNQRLIQKCRDEYTDKDGFPFLFDLTRAPNSIFLNRPHFRFPDSGVFWKLRCYCAEYEYLTPRPEMQVTMNFWKYAYAPLIPNEIDPRISKPMNYIRYETTDDIGDLYLEVELGRDVYYHGEPIDVSLSIENNSGRHVVTCISVFVEQTVRIYRDERTDYSIRLGEVLLQPPEPGLPMQPKSKSFQKKVEVTPRLDLLIYNIGLDGHMLREYKYFLAGSTIIIKTVPLTPKEMQQKEVENETLNSKGAKAKGAKDKGKGSPGKKGSPDKSEKKGNSKKESPKKDSPKKGSPGKKKGDTNIDDIKENIEEENEMIKKIPEKDIFTNKTAKTTTHIAYDIVVRLNLQTPTAHEAGNPQVKVPFVLTRETWMIDKWTIPDAFVKRKLKILI